MNEWQHLRRLLGQLSLQLGLGTEFTSALMTTEQSRAKTKEYKGEE